MNNQLSLKEIAFEKAEAVINSCVNLEHTKGASRYIDLFIDKFSDWIAYTDLTLLLERKEYSIKNK